MALLSMQNRFIIAKLDMKNSLEYSWDKFKLTILQGKAVISATSYFPLTVGMQMKFRNWN